MYVHSLTYTFAELHVHKLTYRRLKRFNGMMQTACNKSGIQFGIGTLAYGMCFKEVPIKTGVYCIAVEFAR